MTDVRWRKEVSRDDVKWATALYQETVEDWRKHTGLEPGTTEAQILAIRAIAYAYRHPRRNDMGIRDDEDDRARIGPLSDMHKANQPRIEKLPDPPTWRPLLGDGKPEEIEIERAYLNAAFHVERNSPAWKAAWAGLEQRLVTEGIGRDLSPWRYDGSNITKDGLEHRFYSKAHHPAKNIHTPELSPKAEAPKVDQVMTNAQHVRRRQGYTP